MNDIKDLPEVVNPIKFQVIHVWTEQTIRRPS